MLHALLSTQNFLSSNKTSSLSKHSLSADLIVFFTAVLAYCSYNSQSRILLLCSKVNHVSMTAVKQTQAILFRLTPHSTLFTALQVMTSEQPRQLPLQKRSGAFQNLADAILMALYLYKMPIPLFSIPALSIAHSYAIIMAVYLCSEWHAFAHRVNRTGKNVLQNLQAFAQQTWSNVCCRSHTLSCAIGDTCSLDHTPEDCSLYLPATSAYFTSSMYVSELFCTVCCPIHAA